MTYEVQILFTSQNLPHLFALHMHSHLNSCLPQSSSAGVYLQPELEVITSEQQMTMYFKFVSSTARTEGVVNISDALQSKAFQNEASSQYIVDQIMSQYVFDILPLHFFSL